MLASQSRRRGPAATMSAATKMSLSSSYYGVLESSSSIFFARKRPFVSHHQQQQQSPPRSQQQQQQQYYQETRTPVRTGPAAACPEYNHNHSIYHSNIIHNNFNHNNGNNNNNNFYNNNSGSFSFRCDAIGMEVPRGFPPLLFSSSSCSSWTRIAAAATARHGSNNSCANGCNTSRNDFYDTSSSRRGLIHSSFSLHSRMAQYDPNQRWNLTVRGNSSRGGRRWMSNTTTTPTNKDDEIKAATAAATPLSSTSSTMPSTAIASAEAAASPKMAGIPVETAKPITNLSAETTTVPSSVGANATTSGQVGETSQVSDTVSKTTDPISTAEGVTTPSVSATKKGVIEKVGLVLPSNSTHLVADVLTVTAILTTFGLLLVYPLAEREMKKSDRGVNDDFFGLTDDPVDDFPRLAREEWLELGTLANGATGGALETVLQDLVRSKALQQAAQQFVVQILESEPVRLSLNRLLKQLWSDLVTDPETVAQVIHLLNIAIQDEKVKAAAQRLVLDLINDPQVKQSLIDMVQSLGAAPDVQQATQDLLVHSAHRSLNDPEIMEHSMEFATDVLGDDVVQQTAGEALRNTVGHAFRPAATIMVTASGISLILFGIVALGFARSSDQEVYLLESAARSLQTNATFGLVRLISWPFRKLYTMGESLGHVIFTIPFRALGQFLHTMVSLPGTMGRTLLSGITHSATIVLQGGTFLWEAMAQQGTQGQRALYTWIHALLSGMIQSVTSMSRGMGQGLYETMTRQGTQGQHVIHTWIHAALSAMTNGAAAMHRSMVQGITSLDEALTRHCLYGEEALHTSIHNALSEMTRGATILHQGMVQAVTSLCESLARHGTQGQEAVNAWIHTSLLALSHSLNTMGQGMVQGMVFLWNVVLRQCAQGQQAVNLWIQNTAHSIGNYLLGKWKAAQVTAKQASWTRYEDAALSFLWTVQEYILDCWYILWQQYNSTNNNNNNNM